MLQGGMCYDLGEIRYIPWAFAGPDHGHLCMADHYCVNAEDNLVHSVRNSAVRLEALEEYLYNQALQSIRYGGMSANEMREYMALIDKYTEVETLYANNAPIEYVVKSPSVDIWRHEAPVITTKRQNLVKDVLFKIVGALNSIIGFIVMVLED